MKRILLAAAVLALMFPAFRQAEARTDISIDFFYDNLGDDGSWVEVGDYGYCWQPTVAVSNRSWRPYTDGYWAYTDVGWTWVSYEDFGWATYHYGRWIRLRGRGWVWVPGREWAPAWVSWRTGGDYVGWAPLPPRRVGEYYDYSPITAQVDIDFDIGPSYYNFIDVRYIGEPVLRERIFAADQNVTYITRTVNVTNITYRDNQVYNYGPDYGTLSRYSTRPIQRLSLQREVNVDPLEAVRSRSLMKVQGDRLVIAAPQTLQKSTTTVAPKVVKEKIAQAPVERGWEGMSDQKAQADLKQKMKAEDPKTVPPPSVQPVREESAVSPAPSAPATSTARATPSTGASPAATTPTIAGSPAASPSLSPAKDTDKGKDKDKDKDKKRDVSPAPTVSASATPAASAVMTPGKDKAKRDEKDAPAATPGASLAPGTTPTDPGDKSKGRQREKAAPSASVSPSSRDHTRFDPMLKTDKAPPTDTRDKGKNKQKDILAPSASIPPASGAMETAPPKSADTDKSDKRKPKEKPAVSPAEISIKSAPPPQPETKRERPEPADGAKPDVAAERPKQDPAAEPASKRPKKEPAMKEQAAPPAPANAPARDEGGKKQKKNEPATSPTP
jgi:Family of unknown function (DUF6600)